MKRIRVCSCLISGNCPNCGGEPYRYELNEADRDLAAAIREEHPDWDDEAIMDALIRFNWAMSTILLSTFQKAKAAKRTPVLRWPDSRK